MQIIEIQWNLKNALLRLVFADLVTYIHVKLLWDISLITVHHVASSRPDIVLFYEQERKIIFF